MISGCTNKNNIIEKTNEKISIGEQSIYKWITLKYAQLAMEEMDTISRGGDRFTDFQIDKPIILTANYHDTYPDGSKLSRDVIIVTYPAKGNREGYAHVYMHVKDNYLYVYNRGYTAETIEEQKNNAGPMGD